jgi:uncharacterized small protein (DUF1192 family)
VPHSPAVSCSQPSSSALPAENGQPENFTAAVSEVSERVSVLIREEIELAKAEVTTKMSSIARGAAAAAAGAVFGVFALIFGLLAVAWVLNALVFDDLWLGFVVVFGVLMALTIGAFLFAWRKLRVGAPAPTMAIEEAKKIRETVGTAPDGES